MKLFNLNTNSNSSSKSQNSDAILIIDFGSQYTQLIARRIRELGVYSEICSHRISEEQFNQISPKGVILSGGPNSVYESINIRVPEYIYHKNIPILGICYGMQVMALQLGGEVSKGEASEYGRAELDLIKDYKKISIFKNIPQQSITWMSHGDKVSKLPEGFELLGYSDNAPIAIMGNIKKNMYGVQFHPEVNHTEMGIDLIQNFIFEICQSTANWKSNQILEGLVEYSKTILNNEQVLLGLSGGVDSSVVAAVLNQAIGKNLICVFVDTGLLRLNEGDEVMQMFSEHMHINVIRVNAQDRFYTALKNITDPESKRKIIGKCFIDVFTETAEKIKAEYSNIKWLAQGTIYPDIIESGAAESGQAHVIKSHHNVGGLPENLGFKLFEPLKWLFKDEVRKLGLTAGLPKLLINRHPFPGPGLGLRVLGEINSKSIQILQLADKIFIELLRESNWYDKVSQAFAVFLPVKSVGVKGDQRCYSEVICLRAVITSDFMTGTWAELPYDLIGKISTKIVNEVPNISRVVYDVTGKPPATIEWE